MKRCYAMVFAFSLDSLIFFLRRPDPASSPLFPYTTLFRSGGARPAARPHGAGRAHGPGRPWRHARSPPPRAAPAGRTPDRCPARSEEHTSELQSRENLVCRLLLEKKKDTEILDTVGTANNF